MRSAGAAASKHRRNLKADNERSCWSHLKNLRSKAVQGLGEAPFGKEGGCALEPVADASQWAVAGLLS